MALKSWTVFTVALVAVISLLTGAAAYAVAGGGSGSNDRPAPSQQQRDALADGVVTSEELDAAEAAYADCAEGAGLTAHVFPGEGLRRPRLAFLVNDVDGVPDADTVRQANRALADCAARHLDDVSSAWARQQQQPSAQDIADVYARMEACLANNEAPGTPVLGQKQAYLFARYGRGSIVVSDSQLDLYVACALAVEAETGHLAPPPEVVTD